jgi:phosphoribosylformylglycinamidine synthase
VRQGKMIELQLDDGDPAAAEARVRAMCEQLLANPVIETYSVSIDD